MKIDDIGRVVRTNRVEITPEVVRKTFRRFSLTMLWGFLERKPYASAQQRYAREKSVIPIFFDRGLNTPELINFDDRALSLDIKTLELTDLVGVFQDPRICKDDKLGYFKMALQQLWGIHNLGKTHGDPYLKNFFRLNRQYQKRGSVYTCDFEYQRISPDPLTTDVLILVADATHLLNNNHPEEAPAIMTILEEVYGKGLSFPFDARDRFFFRKRFGTGNAFFDYFR
jgi:tRNA A-37 threonylcarbamoyl transferase component Bud32